MTALRQRADADARDTAGRYVAVTTDLALTADGQARVTAVSPELAAALHAEPSALLGRRVSDLVHPDERLAVERAQLHGGEAALRLRLRSTTGADLWVQASVTQSPASPAPVPTTRWAFVDATEQVEFEQRLLELASTCHDIFDLLREGIIILDREGRTISANTAAAEFLGVKVEELHGALARAQVVVVDEHGLPMARERLPSTRAFRTGRTQEEAVAYRRRDGTTRWLHARVIPVVRPPAPTPDRVVIVLEDALGPTAAHPPAAVQRAAQTALTKREHDVLQLLARGHDISDAAAERGISVHTTRGHVKQLMHKLGARSQLQAVVFAVRAGIVTVS